MESVSNKPKALGRGLSSLLPNRSVAAAPSPAPAPPAGEPTKVAIELIITNPKQPRKNFRAEQTDELADSIRAHGIIQPILVRPVGDKFQIVAGERRWRAATIAGLRELPVIIQQVTDNEALEIALIENIQREDLNPIETALAFERLSREVGLSQEEIGRRTGKDRVTIANLIRLLRLPAEVQDLVAEQKLSMSHARAILALAEQEHQIELAKDVVKNGLSVRAVETRVQKLIAGEGRVERHEKPLDPNVRAAVDEMARVLGTRVRIIGATAQRGRIEIEYYSQDDLTRLYEQIVSR